MLAFGNKLCRIVLFCGVITSASGLQYKEIFRDDFKGHRIDQNKWNRITAPSTVNNELEHYVADETWQEHGKLVIQAQKRNYGDRKYTSGRVDSRGKFSFTYGEVEWRAKLPTGKGIWSALWLLGNDCVAAAPCSSGHWPPEIDVMEARGDLSNKVTVALHYGVYPNNAYDTTAITKANYTADFHTYKVLWDPNQVVFYVDGKEEFRIMDRNKIPSTAMYLIMNVAVGSEYAGYPDNTTPFPAKFEIDYVTVHRWQ